METDLLFYFVTGYVALVSGVVLAATRRPISLFKTFLISLLFTPVSGIIIFTGPGKK